MTAARRARVKILRKIRANGSKPQTVGIADLRPEDRPGWKTEERGLEAGPVSLISPYPVGPSREYAARLVPLPLLGFPFRRTKRLITVGPIGPAKARKAREMTRPSANRTELREANKRQLIEAQKESGTAPDPAVDSNAARDAAVIDGDDPQPGRGARGQDRAGQAGQDPQEPYRNELPPRLPPPRPAPRPRRLRPPRLRPPRIRLPRPRPPRLPRPSPPRLRPRPPLRPSGTTTRTSPSG